MGFSICLVIDIGPSDVTDCNPFQDAASAGTQYMDAERLQPID
jgi:hypothetical protein